MLFDSSFLVAVMEHPTTWREDIQEKLGGFQPVVIEPVYRELARLASVRNRSSPYASLAKEMVDRGDLTLEGSPGNRGADDELISTALGSDALVATLDGALIKQLKALRIGVVTLAAGRVRI